MGKDNWPQRWIKTDLETVVEKMVNGANLKQEEVQLEGYLPISRIETIAMEEVDLSRVKYVEVDEKIIDKYSLQKGDILFSHINSDKHLGKTAIFNGEVELIHGINLLLIRAKSGFDKKLLNYLFRHYRYQGKFIEVAQRAVNQSSINQKKLNQFQVPIIPELEQKRIVAKLDALFGHLDTLKTKLDRIPELLKNFRQQVLTQAVTGKLTEGQSNLEWDVLENFIESSFYGPRFGKDSYTPDGVATVRTTDMTDNGNIEITKETPRVAVDPKRLDSFKVERNDLLITRTGSIGKMAIYTGEEVVIPSAYLIRFRFNENALTKFIFFCLTSPYGQKVMGLEATAITQPNLNAQKIRAIKIPRYSIEEQNGIVLRVEELFSISDRIESQYHSLKAKIDNLPQAILNKAFKGELVSQDENDEPASVLLERIKALQEEAAPKSKKVKNYKLKKSDLSVAAEDQNQYH